MAGVELQGGAGVEQVDAVGVGRVVGQPHRPLAALTGALEPALLDGPRTGVVTAIENDAFGRHAGVHLR